MPPPVPEPDPVAEPDVEAADRVHKTWFSRSASWQVRPLGQVDWPMTQLARHVPLMQLPSKQSFDIEQPASTPPPVGGGVSQKETGRNSSGAEFSIPKYTQSSWLGAHRASSAHQVGAEAGRQRPPSRPWASSSSKQVSVEAQPPPSVDSGEHSAEQNPRCPLRGSMQM
jgi:hypothetical protein